MKVLLVEDNLIDAAALADRLKRADTAIELSHVESLAPLAHYKHAGIEVVLLDLSLPDGQGDACVVQSQAALPNVPIVVLTADADPENQTRMLRSGAQDYLVKGRFDDDTLLRALRYAVERAHAHELRRRLLHADRLVVVGQLAAGVAHEIANPAAFVQGNLVLLSRRLETAGQDLAALRPSLISHDVRSELARKHDGLTLQLEEARRMTEECLSGLARISNVARDLQSYSRVDRDPVEPLQLNDVVRTTCKLANSVVRHRAALVSELGELPLILGDRAGLEQILTNLIVNAAQAIPEGRPLQHRITVSTRTTSEGILLAVEDTGPGVDEPIALNIFEPFYTTKDRGLGTGLGLSIALEIARAHNGTLSYRPGAQGGARFELLLPLARTLPPPPEPTVAVPEPSSSRRMRVLLVDDEPGIRAVYRELLGVDHDVEVADGGRSALVLIQKNPNFDVILCDLMMPDMDGREVYERLRETHPQLLPRMVFCSGGIVTERSRSFVASVSNPLLEKPIRIERLRATIERVANR